MYRTHTFFLEYEHNINNADVLLATQCSIDRISLLEDLSKHWPGVISIALYLTDAEVQTFLEFVHNSVELRNRRNIAYHIVYKQGVSQDSFLLIFQHFLVTERKHIHEVNIFFVLGFLSC